VRAIADRLASDPIVYVVDDDESVRRALALVIRSAGLHVETFPSAPAFLGSRLADRPTCLVLDVRMPGRSGLDLQAELERTRHDIPIVFLTGHGNVQMSVRAMKGGAVDFLQKPVHDEDLLSAIHRALDRNRETRIERAARAAIERRIDSLTPREHEVLALMVTGIPSKQIAGELGAAEKTIKVHRGRIMRKMQANSLVDLVQMTEKVRRGRARR
jgi:FixJ family two-component response regulator